MKRPLLFAVISLAITAILFVGAIWSASSIVMRFNGLSNADWTAAELIRNRHPLRLIQPEWVSRTPDWKMNWIVAEEKARAGLFFVIWITSIAGVWIKLKKGGSPHATA